MTDQQQPAPAVESVGEFMLRLTALAGRPLSHGQRMELIQAIADRDAAIRAAERAPLEARIAELENECREIASLSLQHEARAQWAYHISEDLWDRVQQHAKRNTMTEEQVLNDALHWYFNGSLQHQPAASGDGGTK